MQHIRNNKEDVLLAFDIFDEMTIAANKDITHQNILSLFHKLFIVPKQQYNYANCLQNESVNNDKYICCQIHNKQKLERTC